MKIINSLTILLLAVVSTSLFSVVSADDENLNLREVDEVICDYLEDLEEDVDAWFIWLGTRCSDEEICEAFDYWEEFWGSEVGVEPGQMTEAMVNLYRAVNSFSEDLIESNPNVRRVADAVYERTRRFMRIFLRTVANEDLSSTRRLQRSARFYSLAKVYAARDRYDQAMGLLVYAFAYIEFGFGNNLITPCEEFFEQDDGNN